MSGEDVLQRVQALPSQTLEDVVVAMCDAKATSCAVVDAEGRLAGLLTESDVVWAVADCVARREAPHGMTVASLLPAIPKRIETGTLTTLATADTFQALALRMGRVNSKNLPVTDASGRYLGTLTALRATRELLRARDAEYVSGLHLDAAAASHQRPRRPWRVHLPSPFPSHLPLARAVACGSGGRA